jgi:glutamyl-tRNA(Gln) and/or aspartyl-tRNA(Asn) amidotransferase, C subunit
MEVTQDHSKFHVLFSFLNFYISFHKKSNFTDKIFSFFHHNLYGMEFDFENILKLSAIDIPEDKKQNFKYQVEKIIEFFKIISELPLDDIQPTTWKFEENQRLREDEPKKFENIQGIIDAFPKKRERFAVVPQVIETE